MTTWKNQLELIFDIIENHQTVEERTDMALNQSKHMSEGKEVQEEKEGLKSNGMA